MIIIFIKLQKNIEAPYNKIGFWHVKDLTTTKEIENDKETSTPLPSSLVDDSFEKEFKLMFKDKFYTWDNYLKETFTDAIIIIKNGAIIYEKYFSGSESDRHLLMSVSKSVTSVCLASTLNSIGKDVTERNFDNLLLTELVPSLKKTSWEGCTLQAVLDMRSGTLFDESNYADPESDGRLIGNNIKKQICSCLIIIIITLFVKRKLVDIVLIFLDTNTYLETQFPGFHLLRIYEDIIMEHLSIGEALSSLQFSF